MISVVDYGVANLGSMLNMLRKVGAEAEVVSTPEDLARATKLILPGIGAFDQGMTALASRGLVAPLKARVSGEGIPILGVCLGMQLLGRSSEEGALEGLGLLDARSERFRFERESGRKVPHMGWGVLSVQRDNELLEGLDDDARFYFVHSYHVVCTQPADVLATAHYGHDFTAMVKRANVWGVQFHPEKSHRFGMHLLNQFAAL